MERKLLRKRKGQWVTLSMSVLASVLTVSAATGSVSAQEAGETQVSSSYLEDDQITDNETVTEKVEAEVEEAEEVEDEISELNEEIVDETVAEEDLVEETVVEETVLYEAEEVDPVASELEKVPETTAVDSYEPVIQAEEAYVPSTEDKIVAQIVAGETSLQSQEGIDAVVSLMYNRAKNQNKSLYEVATAKGQFSPYGNGTYQRFVNADLSAVYDSIKRHKNGGSTHNHEFMLATRYLKNDPSWTAARNNINADLTPYIYEDYIEAGGNTFFTPKDNYPGFKTSEQVKQEYANTRLQNRVNQAANQGKSSVVLEKGQYQVKAGDSLYRIARANNTTIQALKQANNLTSDLLMIGQVLTVAKEVDTEKAVEKVENLPQSSSAAIEANKASTVSPVKTVTVKAGDTLEAIAKANGVTANELRLWNNLPSDNIYTGQNLRLGALVLAPAPAASTQTNNRSVTVKSGDTLYKIANANGVTVAQLRQWNNISGNLIHPGQTLKLGATTTAPSTSAPSRPSAPSQPSTPAQSSSRTVTVKSGDSLYKIANANGVTVAQLRQWNNISGNLIHPGQTLKLGAATTAPSTPAPSRPSTPSQPSAPSQSSNRTVTVKSGDSLYKIANANGVTVAQLRQWNNISGNLIHPGQTLKLGATTTAPAPKPSTPTQPTTPKPSEPAPSQPSAPAQSSNRTVIVKSGDSLYKIANANGVTVAQLRQWNNISGNLIHPGQTLKLGATTTAPAPKPSTPTQPTTPKPNTPTPAPSQPSTPAQSSNRTVTVKSGDTLYRIATANGVTVPQIRQWNNLSGDLITPGQTLKLGAGGSSSSSNRPSTSTGSSSSTPFTGSNLPDLTNATARDVNYQVKLNAKSGPFRTSLNLSARPINAQQFFGQRFVVNRELTQNGQVFLELMQNGRIVGYAPKRSSVEVSSKPTIYIDAGHGGSESGTTAGGVPEKTMNLNITIPLAQRLRAQGYEVYETRTNDKEVPLKERQLEPNAILPDIYLSVHHNAMGPAQAGRAQGIETFYAYAGEPGYPIPSHHNGTNIIFEGKRLSDTIQSYLIGETGATNRGSKPVNYWVVRQTDVPAALVELGFQDNAAEMAKLRTPAYQEKLINGLVKGINAYFSKLR